MLIIQHLWQLILFLVILLGPLPLCLAFARINQTENVRYSLAHFLLLLLTTWSIIQVGLGLILGSGEKLIVNAVILSEILIFIIGLRLIYLKKYSFSVLVQKRSLNKMELLIISATAFVGFAIANILATNPITNYDSLWFHLPAISRWYQTGTFTLLDSAGHWIFDHEQARVYPYNWHILSVLCLLPFASDFLVAFPMLIAWILLGLSVYLLSLKFGATRIHGMAASSLLLTVPMMINQVNTIHIDLPLTAFFTLSLYLAFSYHSSRSLSELSLLFASLGMLAGIKITGIFYGSLVVALLLILELKKLWLKPQKHIRFNFKPKPILFLGITCLLFLGSFWYVRNFLHVNYPVSDFPPLKAPVQPPVPPQPGTPAPSESLQIWRSTLAAQFNLVNPSHWQTLGLQIIARLQLPFMAMLLQAIAGFFALIKQERKSISSNFICLVILPIGTGILYAITPYSSGTAGEFVGQLSPLLGFNLRYGFPFLSMLAVAAAASATLLKTRNEAIVITVLISSILGIVSSEIFDKIRQASFTGNSIVWGSNLINKFKSSFGEASIEATKILASNFSELWLYVALYLGLLVFLIWQLSQNGTILNKIQGSSRIIIVCVCVGLIVSATWVMREKRDANRTEIYRGIYEYIESNTLAGDRIGFAFSCRSYLFYGKKLNREVLYVPFRRDGVSEWADYLRQKNVKIVGVGPLTQIDGDTRKALSWLTSADGYLQPVFGEDFNRHPVLFHLK